MRKQWAYEVTVCDRKGRITYTGKYIDSRRAEAAAQSWLSDTPNGTAYVYGRFDGSCLTMVADEYRESRDFAGFAV